MNLCFAWPHFRVVSNPRSRIFQRLDQFIVTGSVESGAGVPARNEVFLASELNVAGRLASRAADYVAASVVRLIVANGDALGLTAAKRACAPVSVCYRSCFTPSDHPLAV
jgi:hypothetical protein